MAGAGGVTRGKKEMGYDRQVVRGCSSRTLFADGRGFDFIVSLKITCC